MNAHSTTRTTTVAGNDRPRSSRLWLSATTFRQAVQQLQEQEERSHRIIEDDHQEEEGGSSSNSRVVIVDVGLYLSHCRDDAGDDRPAAFGAFVDALQNNSGAHFNNVQEIIFQDVDWQGLRDTDLHRLFHQVLPTHPTLRKIVFDNCCCSDSRINAPQLLASSIYKKDDDDGTIVTNAPLETLVWKRESVDRDAAQAIADMVRRNSPHLTKLVITSTSALNKKTALEQDSLKSICDALSQNTHLRTLRVGAEDVVDNSLNMALLPSSPLKALHVHSNGPYRRSVVAGLATHLPTNTNLRTMSLTTEIQWVWQQEAPNSDRPLYATEADFESFVGALRTHNFTLVDALELPPPNRVVDVRSDYRGQRASRASAPQMPPSIDDTVRRFLARNRRIQRVLTKLRVTAEPPVLMAPEEKEKERRRCPMTMTRGVRTNNRRSCPSLPKLYHLEPAGLWPMAMEVTNGVPTPLYRLLRYGAVDVVAECLQERADAFRGGNNKRGRDESESDSMI